MMIGRAFVTGTTALLHATALSAQRGRDTVFLEELTWTEVRARIDAGMSDTSQLLYVAPRHIRTDRLAPRGGGEGMGVSGDPTLATAEKGRHAIQMKVEAALRQNEELMAR